MQRVNWCMHLLPCLLDVMPISFFTGVFLESTTDFTVDAVSVSPTGEGKARAVITNPSGSKMEALVKNNNDGTYKVSYTPFEQGQSCGLTKKNDISYFQQICNLYLYMWGWILLVPSTHFLQDCNEFIMKQLSLYCSQCHLISIDHQLIPQDSTFICCWWLV